MGVLCFSSEGDVGPHPPPPGVNRVLLAAFNTPGDAKDFLVHGRELMHARSHHSSVVFTFWC
jgi:hypothetical protein